MLIKYYNTVIQYSRVMLCMMARWCIYLHLWCLIFTSSNLWMEEQRLLKAPGPRSSTLGNWNTGIERDGVGQGQVNRWCTVEWQRTWAVEEELTPASHQGNDVIASPLRPQIQSTLILCYRTNLLFFFFVPDSLSFWCPPVPVRLLV